MERMSLDVNKMTKDQLRQHILMLAMELTQLQEENKRLKATLDAYAKQVNRLEQRLLKYEKVHDGKFIEKDITVSESRPLFK